MKAARVSERANEPKNQNAEHIGRRKTSNGKMILNYCV